MRAAPNTFGKLSGDNLTDFKLRATPSYSEPLQVGGAQELRATPSNSELLSAIRIGRTKLPGNRRKLGTPSFELRATPSYSELIQLAPTASGAPCWLVLLQNLNRPICDRRCITVREVLLPVHRPPT